MEYNLCLQKKNIQNTIHYDYYNHNNDLKGNFDVKIELGLIYMFFLNTSGIAFQFQFLN